MDFGDRHSVAVFCAEEGMRFPSRAFGRKAEGMPRCVGEGGWCLPSLMVAASAFKPGRAQTQSPFERGNCSSSCNSSVGCLCVCRRVLCAGIISTPITYSSWSRALAAQAVCYCRCIYCITYARNGLYFVL